MADRNLTSAIFELKDSKRAPQKPEPSGPSNPRRSSPPTLRRRSLDAFYVFAIALLALATIAQIGALIAYR